ncbi:MAG: amidohydrolase [Olsenella sp.]|nr:amidohydrolase [Olsenella sp.]
MTSRTVATPTAHAAKASPASIDVHSHALPQSYLDALDELGVSALEEDGFPTPTWSEEGHLRFMDETGQRFCILSISTPHINRGDDATSARLARSINDELAAICRRHPESLGFSATLPVPAVEASIDEARRAFDELGALGVKVPSNGAGTYLGDPALDPLMEFLDGRKAVVTIHPSLAPAAPEGIFTAGPAPLFEYVVDTTRAVLNLMAHGVIERYPNIRWVVPHAGSFLPPIAHRLMGISGVLVPAGLMEPVDVMANLRHLWWDLAGDARPVMLDSLMKIADPKHLLYGSDTPYTPTEMIARNKEGLAADPLVAPIAQDVFFDNAARLYGLNL